MSVITAIDQITEQKKVENSELLIANEQSEQVEQKQEEQLIEKTEEPEIID